MRSLPLLVALGCTTAGILAQANCSAGAGSPTSIYTVNPFAGSSLYGHPNYPNPPGPTYTGFNFMFDLHLNVPIDITQIDLNLYDSGGLVSLGNGQTVTSPNQVGATAPVEFYIYPGATWVGQETTPSVWGLLGTGTLTVAAAQAHSPAVFATPLSLPAGLWGVAFVVYMTTTGPNPGPLHPMLDASTTVPGVYTNSVLTIDHLQFQRESWTATLASAAHTQNLEWHYTPQAGHADWTSFGTGCIAPNAPVMGLTARPIIGTTVVFQTTNIQANTLFNFWLFGFAPDPNGVPLGSFGLPGCNLYLQLGSAIATNITGVTSGSSTVPLPIPGDPSYSGIVLYGQAAPMTPGFNAGFFASNAVCVALGLY